MSDQQLSRLQLTLSGSELPLPVNVLDRNLQLVQSARCGDELQLKAGTYFVTALLPSGQRATETVELQAGKPGAVTLSNAAPPPAPPSAPRPEPPLPTAAPPHSPYELPQPRARMLSPGSIRDALIGVAVGAFGVRLRRPPEKPVAERFFLRFLPADNAPRVSVDSSREREGTTELVLELLARAEGLVFAQLCSKGKIPINLALPLAPHTASERCRLTVSSNASLSARVELASVEAQTVAAYLEQGQMKAAARLITNAEELLNSKMSDPLAAALGGYAILRAGQLERLHDWPLNLSRSFEWLPDGAVIAGEQALRADDPKTAREQFTLAAQRGLPLFSDGFSILLSRLHSLSSEPAATGGDSGSASHSPTPDKQLNAIAPFVDFASLVLQLRGRNPHKPATTQKAVKSFPESAGWQALPGEETHAGENPYAPQ